MVLEKLEVFETKEREIFNLFCEVRKKEGYDYIEGMKEFYKVLDSYPPDPRDKLEKDLFNLFNNTYQHADKSLQREAIYRESGEPMALIYANLFRDKFFNNRTKLKNRINTARTLLEKHIEAEND